MAFGERPLDLSPHLASQIFRLSRAVQRMSTVPALLNRAVHFHTGLSQYERALWVVAV